MSSACSACAAPSSRASPSRLSPSIDHDEPRELARAAAASSERLGVATMIVSTRARRGSAGLGVSSILPAAPASRCARTAAGGSILNLSSTAIASAKVVRSDTVGPEPITPGSSLGTSEISQDSTRAGCAAIASRPPLIAERCLRTVFISPIWAPDFSSARLTSCLSASVRPGAGRASRAEAPPEIRHSTRSSAERPFTFSRMRPAAARPFSSGTGCAASTISMRLHVSP